MSSINPKDKEPVDFHQNGTGISQGSEGNENTTDNTVQGLG